MSLTILTKLQQLDLAGNSLNSTIPAQLAALSDLKALDLSGNTTARAPARTRVRARERRWSQRCWWSLRKHCSAAMAARSSAAAGHGERHGAGLERAGEGRGRERVERRVPVLYLSTARRADGHANSEGATRPAAPEHQSAELLLLLTKKEKSNTTSNIPLKPAFQPSITPKLISSSTICSN